MLYRALFSRENVLVVKFSALGGGADWSLAIVQPATECKRTGAAACYLGGEKMAAGHHSLTGGIVAALQKLG